MQMCYTLLDGESFNSTDSLFFLRSNINLIQEVSKLYIIIILLSIIIANDIPAKIHCILGDEERV